VNATTNNQFTNLSTVNSLLSAGVSNIFTTVNTWLNTNSFTTLIKFSTLNSILSTDIINLFNNLTTGYINFGSSTSPINMFNNVSVNKNLVVGKNLSIGGEFNCNNALSNTIQCNNLNVNSINIPYQSNNPIDPITIKGYLKIQVSGIDQFIAYYN
jgi:hypothetical protein